MTVNSVLNKNTLKLDTALAEEPQGYDHEEGEAAEYDTYLVIDNAVVNATIPTQNVTMDTSEKFPDRVYVSDTSNYSIGDWVAIRTEVREIVYVHTSGDNYVQVAKPFGFNPQYEGGADECLFFSGDSLYNYYLNKPKVFKVETKRNSSVEEWMATYYEYEYIQGDETVRDCFDPINGSGFDSTDVEGPLDEDRAPKDIRLVSTSITKAKVGSGGVRQDLNKQAVVFAYHGDIALMGQSIETRYYRDNEHWILHSQTVNELGRVCVDADYYGTLASFSYKGVFFDVAKPSDPTWKTRTLYDHDAYGRVIRTRTWSSNLDSAIPVTSWLQYVGIGTTTSPDNDLDPFDIFADSPYSSNYQTRFDSFFPFTLVGATASLQNADGVIAYNYRDFEGTYLNLTISRAVEKTTLSGDDLMLSGHGYVDGKRDLDAAFTYDKANNNALLTITNPDGQVVTMVYGTTGWDKNFVLRDFIENDNGMFNGADTTQWFVNDFTYDILGQLLMRNNYMSSTDPSGSITEWTDSGKYPAVHSAFIYDGMGRVIWEEVDSDSPTQKIKFHEYDDDNLWMKVTNYLGFQTKTTFDEFYRPIKVETYKSNADWNLEANNDGDGPTGLTVLKTGRTDTTYDVATGNQTSVTWEGDVGSGSQNWGSTLNLKSQYHPASDIFNYTMVAVLDSGGAVLAVIKNNYAGMLDSINIGADHASPDKAISYVYDQYMRTRLIQSDEDYGGNPIPTLCSILTRDTVGKCG